MTDREWLEALRAEIARMADDMEMQRRAYVDLIARSEELAADLDRTSAAYLETSAELRRIQDTLTWRVHERLVAARRVGDDNARSGPALEDQVPQAANASAPAQTTSAAPGARNVPVRQVRPEWTPRVSIIVPTRDRPDLLTRLFETLAHTSWDDVEVVLVDNQSTDEQALALLDTTDHLVVRDAGAFNFPRLIGAGAAVASGEVLVLLNNDIEVQDSHWLAALVDCLALPGCGIAGGLLLYPDGTVQHIGIDMMDGEPIHVHAHSDLTELPAGLLDGPRACAAVTGACLGISRETWDALGGLDPLFAQNYNDVDLCLRAEQAGFSCMVTPLAVLTHKESATRGDKWNAQIAADRIMFRARWGVRSAGDVSPAAEDGPASGAHSRH